MIANEVAQRGVELVIEELEGRGASAARATATRSRNSLVVQLPSGTQAEVYVKTRRTGTWQTDIRKGSPAAEPSDEHSFWIFVDLTPGQPAFYVAPAWWVENDVYEAHRAYLARHGGRRARTPTSNHHSISADRISKWRDRWDRLGTVEPRGSRVLLGTQAGGFPHNPVREFIERILRLIAVNEHEESTLYHPPGASQSLDLRRRKPHLTIRVSDDLDHGLCTGLQLC